MATEPKAAKAADPTKAEFIVVGGQLVTGPRGKRQTYNEGDGYSPANATERDDLLARGAIVPAAEFAKLSGGATVVNALKAAEARAQAAEQKVAEMEAAAAAAGNSGNGGNGGGNPNPAA